jgi:hypothetical protein
MSYQPVRGGRLPIGPWRDWLLTGPLADKPASELAATIGTDEAVIRRWRDSPEQNVSLDIVDRALCRLNQPGVLNDLYPACWPHGAYEATCPVCARTRLGQLDLELVAA